MDLLHLVDKQIGERLRSRRAALDMSWGILAHRLGTTTQQVREFEAGTVRIGFSRLLKLAKILKVDPNYFLEAEDGSVSSGDGGANDSC